MDKIEVKFKETKSYKHHTGKEIKVFPFVSNVNANNLEEDLKSFEGVVGSIFRYLNSKKQVKGLDKNDSEVSLKKSILENALSKVETSESQDLKRILSNLYFDDKGNLIKFHIDTLSYLDFISSESSLRNIGKFVYDTFFYGQKISSSGKNKDDENILNNLILESLPELPCSENTVTEKTYQDLQPKVSALFKEDLIFLKENNELFLNHIEDLIKFYYFQYFAQLIIDFRTYSADEPVIKPISFTLDWEILSSSRVTSQSISWKNLFNDEHKNLFVHANVLELLNYIYIDEKPIGDYRTIKELYNELNEDEKTQLEEGIRLLTMHYTNSLTVFNSGSDWEDCEEMLIQNLDLKSFNSICDQLVYELWYKVKYQFENSSRGAASKRYITWFSSFCDANFLKNRGRLGKSFTLNQEFLLFITRLCIGKNDKIRLKQLWVEFEKRGIHFDENSKAEIVNLFEKINLIEKKSDSGDAQYVKSII